MGCLGGIRTHGPQFRKLVRYPLRYETMNLDYNMCRQHLQQFLVKVPRRGFEPLISRLRTWRLNRLDQRGLNVFPFHAHVFHGPVNASMTDWA